MKLDIHKLKSDPALVAALAKWRIAHDRVTEDQGNLRDSQSDAEAAHLALGIASASANFIVATARARADRIRDAQIHADTCDSAVRVMTGRVARRELELVEAAECVHQAIDAIIASAVLDEAAAQINTHLNAALKVGEEFAGIRNDLYRSAKDRWIPHPGIDNALVRLRPILQNDLNMPRSNGVLGPAPSDFLPNLRAELWRDDSDTSVAA